jgi:hypothetical protein
VREEGKGGGARGAGRGGGATGLPQVSMDDINRQVCIFLYLVEIIPFGWLPMTGPGVHTNVNGALKYPLRLVAYKEH